MSDIPIVAAADIQRMLRAELSLKTRMMYLAGLLAAGTFAAALLSLWFTEPHLPLRTHIAFGILVVINLAWTFFCGWALTRKKVLYARQGVIAGRLAALWSAVFMCGALIAGYTSGHLRGGMMAAASGFVFLAFALVVLRRALARHQELLRLRHSLDLDLETNLV